MMPHADRTHASPCSLGPHQRGILRPHATSLPVAYYNFLQRESGFIGDLIDISRHLCDVPITTRLPILKSSLAKLNARFPATVYIPLCIATDEMCCLLRIATEESFVFSTRERAPFMMLLEVRGSLLPFSNPQPFTLRLLPSTLTRD